MYGRSLRFFDALISGAILGVVAFIAVEVKIDPNLPVFPMGYLVMAFIPLLFARLSIPIFIDIRFPRRSDLSFVAGISRKQRIERGVRELADVNKWLIILISTAIGSAVIGNGAFRHGTFIVWDVGLAIASVIEAFALSYGTSFLLRHGTLRPSRKDSTESSGENFSQKIGGLFIAVSWTIAGKAVSPLKKQVKAIARRQLTDLLRGDPLSSIVLPLAALAVSILFAVILKDSPRWVFPMIFAFIAYGIVLFNDEVLQESSARLSSLLNYRFSFRDFYFANGYIILLLTFPVIIAFLIFGIVVKPGVFTAMGTIQFLVTYAYLVACAGCRHTLSPIPNRDVVSAYLTYGFPIVALPSLGIPVFGFLFPAILIVVLLSMEGDVLKRTPFQRVCVAEGSEFQ
jgi:hypothetical protein